MQKNLSRKPLEIRMATVMAVAATLRSADLAVLNQGLIDLTGGAADFFDQEFAVADISQLDAGKGTMDWTGLVALFGSYRINLVAVRHAPPDWHAEILAAGLSLESSAPGREDAPVAVSAPAPAPAPVEAAAAVPSAMPGSMIIDTPVRAGQRVYARGTDLIVTAAVNNGAEVIADGSIHVYAPLRGRALAGASGDARARIFALSMEAELVSIAGIYRTFEQGVPAGLQLQPVQIRSVGDRIDLIAFGVGAKP